MPNPLKETHSTAKRQGRRAGTVIALILLAAAAAAFMLNGAKQRRNQLRDGEAAGVLLSIADAEERFRSSSKDGLFLDISGHSPEGVVTSFYPGSHALEDAVPWSPGTCSDVPSREACASLRRLGVERGVAVWFRYGGTSGVGIDGCRLVARRLGLPEPSISVAGGPWFILLAVDGQGGLSEAVAYTSWDKAFHPVQAQAQ